MKKSTGFIATALFVCSLLFSLHLRAQQDTIYYNCGAPALTQYISVAGDTFLADLHYSGGNTGTFTNNNIVDVLGTDDDQLYRTERSANTNAGGSATNGDFSYNIPVANGTYQVDLHFAEIFYGATGGNNLNPPHTGKRVFNVLIEGNTVLANYDIVADVGSMTAVVKTFANITVSDGGLTIYFDGIVNRPKVSALVITPGSIIPSSNTPPTFTISTDNVNLDEDFAGTSTVTVTPDPVPPADAGQTVTYSISPSVSFANVSINASTGTVSITKVNNGNGSQLFTITANDGQPSNNLATKTFTLTVNAVNDAPAFTTSGNVTVNENFAGTQNVTVTPTAVPADEAGQTVTYTLDPASVAFANVSINNSTGQVSITSVADASGSQVFTITANDAQASNNTATQNFTLTVNDTTNTPTVQGSLFYNTGGAQYVALSGDTFKVEPPGIISGATSVYTNPTANLEIAGTDDDVLYRTERSTNVNLGSFGYIIPVQNGSYTVRLHFAEIFYGATGGNNSNLPHTGKRVFDVTLEGVLVLDNYDIFADVGAMTAVVKEYTNVQVNDGNINIDFTSSANKAKISAISIIPTNIAPPANTPPSFTTSGNVTVDEDFAGTQTVTVTPNAVPPAEAGQVVTYTLSPPSVAFANVSINSSTGEVSITNVSNANGFQTFTITANDGQASNNIATQNFNLTVNAVNDAPAFTTSGDVTVDENFAGSQTVTVTPAAVPADEVGQVVGYSLTPPSVAFANVSINPNTGAVTITAVLNGHGSQNFTITANDGQGLNNIATQNFTLTVNDTISGNTAPTVSITAPTNGASFIENTPIQINATANDADGTISKVEFYEGLNLLSTDFSFPYSFTWNNATPGGKSLTAKAFDNLNASTTSAAVNITVHDDQAPTVSITSPANGASFFEGQTITINATANDDVGVTQVDFFAGATFLGSDNTFPYSYNWTNATEGSYSLTAVAFDTQVQGTTSAAVNITVDTVPAGNLEALLVVHSLSLNNGDQAWKTRLETHGFNVTLVTASASVSNDATGKNLVVVSSTVTAASVGNKFTNVAVPLIACEQAIFDDLGLTSGSSGNSGTSPSTQTQLNIIGTGHPLAAGLANGPVTVYAPAQTVTWGKPNGNAAQIATMMTNSSQIAIFGYESGAAMVTGNAPARRVGFFLQDAGAAFLTASGTALLDAAITWVSNSTPPVNNLPTVSITNPTNGSSLNAPANITIEATANDSDGSISKVEFYQGVNLLGTDFNPPYSFNWNGVAQGNYQLTAKAFDNLNASATSAIINITVNPAANVPPTVSIVNPTNGATFATSANITIDATANDPDGSITKVEFYEGLNLLATDFTFPYSFNWNGVTQGTYQLTAKAFDNATASTTSTIVSVTVNPPNVLPTVSITSPTNGASFVAPANITIDATANDPDGSISKVEFYQGVTLLATDFTAPYSFGWNGVGAGSYQLTAKAFDNLNASTTSTIINITVDPAPTLGNILLVVGNLSLNNGDNAMKTRIENLGYTVTVKLATASVTGDATGKSAVVISSTVNSNDVGSKFTNVTVPLLNNEQALHDDLKMVSASGGNAGSITSQNLNITGAGHPLAAGLSNGTVQVYSSSQGITWGKPSANAVKIAATTTGATNISIFGYEANAVMVGLNAPARRVGFFNQDAGAAFFTASGAALFDAAINWLVAPPPANQFPTVNIVNPANGATFNAPANITIDATANDNDGTISKVEFYNGATLLSTDFTFPYSFNWNGVAAGSYQLTAKAFDNVNASTTSAIVNVTVNALPTVSITNPTNGQSFLAPANIQIDATANDADGSISKVEFYNGAALLATDFTSPFSFNWSNVPVGNYQLTAKAFDNLNATTTSTIVNIAVTPPNVPPTVSITSPTNGTVFTAPANVTIDATANDSDGSISKVEFYEGANLLHTDFTFPYSFNWNGVTQGSYALTAKAFDNVNASVTSSIVNITVNQLPTVSITNPANGAVLAAPANITIQVSASDVGGTISKVEFYNGASLLGTDFTFPYSLDWNGVTQGNYQLTAKAFDNLNASTTSSVVNVTVNQLPTVAITSPANGAGFTVPTNITIEATASDAGGSITKVEFYQGVTLLGTDFSAPYSFDWNGVAAGNYQLTAKAFDNQNGTTISSVVNIVVSPGNLPPVVTITNPANNTNLVAPANISIQASATDSDGSISKVEFYVGATLLGTDFTAPYGVNWNSVNTGTYQITARAYDNLNVPTTSSIVFVVVNAPGNNIPTVSITSPADGANFTAPANITIDVTASDAGGSISKVEFYRNGVLLGTDNTFPYSFAWNSVAIGNYQLTARAYDNLNVSALSTVVNIQVNSPVGPTALFVVGSLPLNPGDAAVHTKLQNLGYTVTSVTATAAVTGDATGKSLVLISSTVSAGNVGSKFTNVAVPLINWESGVMDDLKMTGTAGTEFGTVFNQTQIDITGAGHPLAAGLPNGLTTIVNSVQTFTWGKPSVNAVSIASISGAPTQIVIFGYTTGSTMVGLNAPARRVGFFLADVTATALTTPGDQLLEAAILWATSNSKNDGIESAPAMEQGLAFDAGVYPNPSSGNFNITVENAVEGKFSIGIYSYTGQEVYFNERTVDAGSYRENLNLTEVPAGMYLIRVTNGEATLVRRVMISR